MLLVLLVLTSGCRGPSATGRELEVTRRVPLPRGTDARTLFVDEDGRLWVGAPGELRAVGPGPAATTLATGAGAVVTVLGRAEGLLYVRAGDVLLVLDPGSGRTRAERGDMAESVLALDPQGRYVYQAAPSGAVLAHDPLSLEPEWGWAALGRAATAAAVSALGDRFYLALDEAAASAATLLERDLQTGRILSRAEFPAPIRELVSSDGEALYALVGDRDAAAVLALASFDGEIVLRWRHVLRNPDALAAARLRHSPATDRLAVFVPGQEEGIRLLDAETGESLGVLHGEVRDAAFGPGGLLYVLRPGGVLVVR